MKKKGIRKREDNIEEEQSQRKKKVDVKERRKKKGKWKKKLMQYRFIFVTSYINNNCWGFRFLRCISYSAKQ